MITIVLCKSNNGVIGFNGKLPWKCKCDLKFFQSITMGKTIVMGRITWESLPNKPLPGRRNVVITSSTTCIDVATTYKSLEECIEKETQDLIIIGGEQLYNYAVDKSLADFAYINTIDLECKGDRYFLKVEGDSSWELIGEELVNYDDESGKGRVFNRAYKKIVANDKL